MHNVILDASARAAFVTAWADAEEEAGRTHGGEDYMDIAPKTPPEARDWAWTLWQKIWRQNTDRFAGFQLGGKHEEPLANWIEAAWAHAAEASGIDIHDDAEQTEFGHYVAMQAMGHGVSWEDDHEKKGFKLPHVDGMHIEASKGDDRENPDWRKLGGLVRRGARAGVTLTKRAASATAQATREFHAGWRANPRANGRAHPVSTAQALDIMSAAGVKRSGHSISVGASMLYDMGGNRWSIEGPSDDVEYWLGLAPR